MDMARVWPMICQFGIGGVLAAIGFWCGITSGYLDLKNAADRRFTLLMVAGFLALLLLSCAFTFWLPNIPAEAAP